MDDDLSVLLGLKFGISIYEQLNMGIGGWYSMPRYDFTHDVLPLDKDFLMDLGYGAIYFEYIYNPDELLHFNFNCNFGVGQTSVYTHYNEECDPSYSNQFGSESFGIIEPGIQLEVNFFSWMKVAFGGSYRFLYEFGKFYDYKKSDYEGLSGVITFRFSGKF